VSSSLPARMDTAHVELDPGFVDILQRAISGEELSVAQGERLFHAEGEELSALIQAANEVRRRRVGNIVTFVVNRNINHSNICVGSCKFCAFRRSVGDSDAYVLTVEQIGAKVREAIRFGATEICIQGGLHPAFGLKNYLGVLRTIREISPHMHIHAFSPAELDFIAELEGLPVEDVIRVLRDAGLNSVPGTAAEILVDRVRSIICPNKISAGRWMEIIKKCHRLDLPTTATMLYGTVETPRERAEHLALLRKIQSETRGFTEFVPLAFMSSNTPLQQAGTVAHPPDLAESLRVHAIARLMLAGWIDNIQVSWVKLGSKNAQMMLNAGANDLSGTLMEENISRAAGGSGQAMSPKQLEALIHEIGRIPRQRTTTYNIL
jgi:7,8-didemethyl-8-hydroxy-5-deazariboflavin synthase CofH subunit